MFKIFSFGINDIGKISGIMQSFLNDIDLSEFTKSHEDTLADEYEEKTIERNNNFIELKQDEDMYLLTINLKGINLRELSIRYDPGIIEVNLNRSEVERGGFGILSNNVLVKRAYNKKFENIEEINTDQILKSIDNGILSMRMPKKYVLESETKIIEVDSYEDNVDN